MRMILSAFTDDDLDCGPAEIVKRIKMAFDLCDGACHAVGVDCNGMGQVVFDALRDKGLPVERWHRTVRGLNPV